MRESGERWIEPELLRVQAKIEQALRPASDSAELQLRAALEKAHLAGALSFELRIACDLCELLPGQHETQDLLASLLAQFQEGAKTPDQQRARALLGGER
jgi:hypothetical protein